MADGGSMVIAIEGMSCASCVSRAEKALCSVPGVASASVNLATERAVVSGPDLALPALVAALQKVGFDGHLAARDEAAKLVSWRPVWLAAPAALILAAPMALAPFGVHVMLPPLVALLLAGFVQIVPGSVFYVGAWRTLRAGAANMDVLVALGTTAAFGLSCWNLLAPALVWPLPGLAVFWSLLWPAGQMAMPDMYFESAATIVALVLLGRALESRARSQTASAIRGLIALRPATALVRRDGAEIDVKIDELRVGDLLVILPGGRIAADGVLIEGSGAVDESHLTGESLPVEKSPGDTLSAGALCGPSRLVARATKVGAETTLARMMRLVEASQAAKPAIQLLVDRVAAVFVPVIVGGVALTVLVWILLGAPVGFSILAAVSVLVIACPCALGLATPAAIMAGTGAAARAGILIRDPAALEMAGRIRQVVFDKTGTLTIGRPTLADAISLDGDKNTLLRLAAGLQAGSEHPLALAVLALARAEPAGDVTAIPGQGVRGVTDGRTLLLGNARLMAASGIDIGVLDDAAARLAGQGASISYLAEAAPAPRLLGLLAFADMLKPTASDAIARLRARGLRTIMLSGDHPAAVAHIASQLGLDEAVGGVAPDQKAERVAGLHAIAPVAMIGDGINDAPALAVADLGMAMATGTDVAIDAAAITLMRGDPALVADALDIAARTQSKIRQGLAWAFVYNVIGIPLAAMGLLSPTLAGAAMAMSSVSVVSNAILLGRWRPARATDGRA